MRHSIKPPNGSIFGRAQSCAFGKSNEIGDRAGEGTTLNNISQIHKKRGDYDTALHYLEQSLKIRRQIGDTYGIAENLHHVEAAFVVVFPLPWVYRSDSAASITAMHKRVVRFKYRAQVLSAGLHLFALGVLTWVYLH